MGRKDGPSRGAMHVRRPVGHQDLSVASVLENHAELEASSRRQVRRRICCPDLHRHGSLLLWRLVSTVSRLLENPDRQHPMHDRAAPPHHEPDVQFDQRHPDPLHPSTSVLDFTPRIQAQTPPGFPVQFGHLHHDLRHLEQSGQLQTPLQLRVGLLVLSGGEHGHDCQQHALQLGVDSEGVPSQVVLGRLHRKSHARGCTVEVGRTEFGRNSLDDSASLKTVQRSGSKFEKDLLDAVALSKETCCPQQPRCDYNDNNQSLGE